ncbi:Bifunctional uridylyltransferase/uridylyl-removing enzyme [Rhizoctonia solani]|uniref:Bifunctional uridylyltransferase/uridylyl-removing enzyme n=1 Tax=Rhizoctonia solani TaxID=456999 RepID=A0A0K6GAC8_9AGAM|nr:Bifunctional uridylyltransferase/uridylyl-removing enzyme [Rhizoctonia solani]
MPKRARNDKAFSTPVANDIIYHNEPTISQSSQTTSNIHWFDERRPLLQPLPEQMRVGQRRKFAPRKMAFKVGSVGQEKRYERFIAPPGCKDRGTSSTAAEYWPDLEGGWEDIEDPGPTQTQVYASEAVSEKTEKDVKDRYRELIYTHRRFLHVLNLRQAGHLFDNHPSELKPGDQALPCGFCPRPGYNFEWSEVSSKERVWFRLPVSYDGNTRSVRKDKKVDAGDIALSDGLGYSLEKAPAKQWTIENRGFQRTEKPKCDHHKAGNDTSVRFLGRDVTGMGAFTCASHGCFIPGGTVDFYRGELFIYADLGFAGFYKYMTMGGKLDILMTYDVMCHWIVKFRERAKNLPPNLAIPPELNLIVAIPKWHLAGHNPECYVRYSLDHTQHAGRIDGEGPERVWAHQNESSGSTSEQGPGMRTDSVNNIGRDWNFEVQCRLRDNLPAKYRKALGEYLKQKSVHDDLTKTFDDETIKEWEGESLEPFQDVKGNWLSPLMDPIFSNGNFQTSIQDEKEKEAPTARVAGRRPGATRWLSSGIELEHSFQNTREKYLASGKNPTRKQKSDVDHKRLALRDRMVAHETKRAAFMGETEAPDHPSYSPTIEDWMENTMIIMPSSFTPETIASAGLSSLGELEVQLRSATCRDALESLRELLGAKAFALNYKTRQARAQGAMTRARSTIENQSDQIQKTRWRYNNSRDALIRLGHIKDDDEVFKLITDNDTRTLKEYIEETSRGVGQGHAVISWIWRNTVVRNDGQWEINVLRTEWFRSRERYKRWQEQLVLLKREMVMGIRSNVKQREIWNWKAEQPSTSATPGMASYALAKSEWFGKFAASLYKAFDKYLKDDTVELEWCSAWLANNVNEDGLIM